MKNNKFRTASLMLIGIAMAGYCCMKSYKSHAETQMTDIMKANVEALAAGESGGYFLKCWKNMQCENINLREEQVYCGDCTPTVCTNYWDESFCQR